MNVLIVYAHPEPTSFNSAMKELAVKTLSKSGHQVSVSDLYAMSWNPVTGAGDFVGERLCVLARSQIRHRYIQRQVGDGGSVKTKRVASGNGRTTKPAFKALSIRQDFFSCAFRLRPE